MNYLIDDLDAVAWAVEGAKRWAKDGLIEPEAVVAAVDEYRSEEDRLSQFVDECFEWEDDAKLTRAQMRSIYDSWVQQNGEGERLTAQRLHKRLKKIGVRAGYVGKARGWEGLKVRSAPASGLELVR